MTRGRVDVKWWAKLWDHAVTGRLEHHLCNHISVFIPFPCFFWQGVCEPIWFYAVCLTRRCTPTTYLNAATQAPVSLIACFLFFSSKKNSALSQVVTKLRPGAGVCMAFSHPPVDPNEFFLFIPDPKMFAISVSRINRRGDSRTNHFQVSHHRIPYMNLMFSSVHPTKIFPTRYALLCLPTRHISYYIMICSKTCEPERSFCAQLQSIQFQLGANFGTPDLFTPDL